MSSRRRTTTSSRGRGGSRAAASSNDNSTAILIGVGVVVLGGVAWLLSQAGGGGGGGDAEAGAKDETAKPAAASTSGGSSSAPAGSATAGKTPSRPAPPFPQAMQDDIRSRLKAAKDLCNDAVRAQSSGAQQEFKDKGRACQKAIAEIKDILGEQLEWQESAVMEGWAQPADYVQLEKLWGEISKLDKKARMIGS